MQQYEITLLGAVPSKKNSKRRVKRGASVFMLPSAAHERWHEEQMWSVRPQWRGRPAIQSAEISMTFYASDRRERDLTNGAESVMDLLVDAGVIADDNWFVIKKNTQEFGGVDKANPRVEVVLQSEDDGMEEPRDVQLPALRRASH